MSAEYDVRDAGNGRIIVLLGAGANVDRDRIIELLAACGIDPAMVSFVEANETRDCTGIDGVPVVVPIDRAAPDAPELEEGARNCAQAGGRVIVLIDGVDVSGGLHPIASNYGTQCGWSPEQLVPRLAGGQDAAPVSGTGEPIPWSFAKPVKCGG